MKKGVGLDINLKTEAEKKKQESEKAKRKAFWQPWLKWDYLKKVVLFFLL